MTEAWIKEALSLLGVLLGGTVFGHFVSGKKNTNDDKQVIIDQLQEERINYMNELAKRDVKIDELYEKVRNVELNYTAALQDKMQVEWELHKQKEINATLLKENEELVRENTEYKIRIEELEIRVFKLEKEN